MKAFVIASHENKTLATRLLKNSNVDELTFSDPQTGHFLGTSNLVRKSILQSSIIVVLIDQNTNSSSSMKEELKFALSVSKRHNKLFIPVLLNGASYLDCLKDVHHLILDTSSEDNISFAQERITGIIASWKIEKRAIHKPSYLIIMTLAIEVMCIFLVSLLYDGSKQFYENPWEIIITFISALCGISTLAVSYLSIMKKRHQEANEEEIEFYSRRLKSAIIYDKGNNKDRKNNTDESKVNVDALGRMLINLEDIKEFYTWSQKQAKAAFILAVSMCIFGGALIFSAVLLPVVFKLNFDIAIIPTIGGVITELIAGTALIVYKSSLKQLNHYHKALHEDERFLSSVNLIEKFSSVEIQDEMLKEIIRSEIQMNLSSIQSSKTNES